MWFFNFFHQRVANLRLLGEVPAGASAPGFPGSFLPERFVVAVASLDALAHHWARLYPLAPTIRHGERLARFLLTHANADLFARCSMPDLHRRAAAHPNSTAYTAALTHIPGSYNTLATQRMWRDDPTLDSLVSHPAVVAANIDRDWLRRSRYGELLMSPAMTTGASILGMARVVNSSSRSPSS